MGLAMAGRKKRSGIREPSGRLSRSLRDDIGGYPGASIKRLVDAAVRGVGDREWGTPLGQLCLHGKITPTQFEAGKRWDNLARIYYAAIQAPKEPDSVQFGRSSASNEPDPESDEGIKRQQRREKIIVSRWAANAALVAAGPGLYETICAVCEGHELPGLMRLEQLKRGLNALIAWWEVDNEKV